jgi:predicted RNase H-like nuclease (RuvC/YqgF family)
MRMRIKAMQDTIENVRSRNAELECRSSGLVNQVSKLTSKLKQAKNQDSENNNLELEEIFVDSIDYAQVHDYFKEIETLK